MLRRRSNRLLLLALPLLLTAAVVALGGTSALRKVESFQPIGFQAQRDAGAWRVTGEPEPRTGLLTGDQIVLVNGAEATLGAEQLRQRLTSRAVSELLVLRGEAVAEVRYRRPDLDIDFPFLILALAACVYLLIGLYTLLKHRDSRQGLVFFAWCLASAVIYLFTASAPYDRLDRVLVGAEDLARLLLPPLTLHLFLIFPTPLSGGRFRRYVPFLYLPAAVLSLLQVDLAFFGGALTPGQPMASTQLLLDRLFYLLLAICLGLSLAALLYRRRQLSDWEARRQLRWIVVGVAGGYLPFLALYGLPRLLSLEAPPLLSALAVLSLAIVPVTFAYALLRYKLWDVDVIVRDTIASTLTLLLAILGFGLINRLLASSLPEQMATVRNLMTFAAGLALAGLLAPTRRTVASSLERLQYRGAYGRRRALADLGQELLYQRDLEALCSQLLGRLAGALQLPKINLFLLGDDGGGALRPVRPHPGLPDRLPASSLDERVWLREVTAVSGVELPGEETSPEQQLFIAGYRYAFPLKVRGRHVGLLVCGYRIGQEPLSSDDIELVGQVMGQAALAIENAQLLVQLSEQLAEVRHLQEYSQGIIESTPAGIAVLDELGIIRSANRSFARLVGHGGEMVVGRPVDELLPVALPRPTDGLIEASLTEYPGGEERYLQLSVAAIESDPPESVLVLQDVSDRVAMEAELKEKERLASLGMLAAGVAHEVNTPITGISSYAQMLLQDTPADDPRRGILKKVERQTFRAATIVRNLLDFARRRDGEGEEGEQRPVGMTAVIDECIELLRERCDEQSVELTVQLPGDEVYVLGNETEIQQVFTNLVVNAIEAMKGGGRLKVALSADDDAVRGVIEDDGPGIPQDQLDKIFQPFYSTKLGAGGTGLGLSISYEIVRRHGGEMRVVSHPGEGSSFIVELPRRPTAKGEAA